MYQEFYIVPCESRVTIFVLHWPLLNLHKFVTYQKLPAKEMIADKNADFSTMLKISSEKQTLWNSDHVFSLFTFSEILSVGTS